jgi:hypothetical protein
MKNQIVIGIVTVLFVVALAGAVPGSAWAGVDVNISIPLFGFIAPGPPVVYAPSPPVYYAPAAVPGAVFYGGFWYRSNGGNWFIAANAGGPWSMVAIQRVPHRIISGPVPMHRAPSRAYGYGRRGGGPWHGRGW